MAIQPIDLQAIFSQVDKVGKNQAVIREGQQLQDTLNQIQNQRKLEANIQSVNEAQNMGEETAKIKDGKGSQANQGGGGKGKQGEKEEIAEEDGYDLIKDPSLGRIIDISG
jgi:hypothetical protein